jgi:ABC-2 type transport system ATP-binding protein
MASVIETDGLTKYYGSVCGVEGLDMRVDEGEVFGFIGPNGAGKTTTIRTLLDMIFPTGGSARIFGKDTHSDSKEIKRSVGYLPSEDYFYQGMTGRELLRYSARIAGLDTSDLRSKMEGFADRLELDLNAKIKTLSRGNRRKVSIIKALLPGAKLLILDEPTSGLDPLMQNRFFEIIGEEQNRGVTVFFSSHILSEVQRICTRVAIIKDGRIVRTEAMDRLTRENFSKITLELKTGASIGDLEIEGVEDVERRDGSVRFIYRGPIESLLSYLVSTSIHTKLENLFVERSTLDEIFLGYYRAEQAEEES